MGIWFVEAGWALDIGGIVVVDVDVDMKWGMSSLVDFAVAVALVGMDMDMGLVVLAVCMDSHIGSELEGVAAEQAVGEVNKRIAHERW